MTTSFPYPPRTPTGVYSVAGPANAKLGELVLWQRALAPPEVTPPDDWSLYVPCILNYAKDIASTDAWTTPSATFGDDDSHPDGDAVCVPSTLTNLATGGPARSGRCTWSWWVKNNSGIGAGYHTGWDGGTSEWEFRDNNNGTTTIDGVAAIRDSANVWQSLGSGYTAGQWHQFVMVQADAVYTNRWDVYVDGEVKLSAVNCTGTAGGGVLFYAAPGRVVARLKRWTRGLSADEVAALWAAKA